MCRISVRKEYFSMKKALLLILSLVIFILPCLSSCSIGTNEPEQRPTVILSRVNITLSVGDEYLIEPTVYPVEFSDAEITWTSSREELVSCDGGKIVAKAPGVSIIKAAVAGGNTASARVEVVDGVSGHKNLIVGASIDIPVDEYKSVIPTGEVTWVSTNPEIAACDGSCITALSVGTTTIRAVVGGHSVSVFTVSVYGDLGSMVDFVRPELPVSLNYTIGGQQPKTSTVEVYGFEYVITEDESYGVDTLGVTFKVKYRKTADTEGEDGITPAAFIIDLYSDEVGYCTTYRILDTDVTVGYEGEFEMTFLADTAIGHRSFNIAISEAK